MNTLLLIPVIVVLVYPLFILAQAVFYWLWQLAGWAAYDTMGRRMTWRQWRAEAKEAGLTFKKWRSG